MIKRRLEKKAYSITEPVTKRVHTVKTQSTAAVSTVILEKKCFYCSICSNMAQFAYYVVLLMFCGTGSSLETTSPQQQTNGATKDLCEVKTRISIGYLLIINLLNTDFKD